MPPRPLAPGLSLIDTRLGDREGITGIHLVEGEAPALVDAGAQTSVATVREALAQAGLGPDDLAWIVLTHIHLDHAGATGDLARAFPRARVVVHRRGVRHLIDPQRLVSASAAVYGERAPIYGGLTPTPAERIDEAPDGHRVRVGPGRELRLIETLGHARHHLSVLDEATGTVLAGDAAGARLGAGRVYPTMPPADLDVERGLASIARLAALEPERLCPAHFGPVPDPAQALSDAHEQLARAGEAVASAVSSAGGVDRAAVGAALAAAIPVEETVGDPVGARMWRELGWDEANIDGFAAWAQRGEDAA